MAEAIYLVDGGQGEAYRVDDITIATTRAVQYASEWFAAHPRRKPPLKVAPITEETVPRIVRTVVTDLRAREVDYRVIVAYLYYHFRQIKTRDAVLWESFDRQISAANTEVSIENIFEVDESESAPRYTEGPAVIDNPKAYILAICTAYRALPIKNDLYRTQIINEGQNLINTTGIDDLEVVNVMEFARQWMTYAPFRAIMAGIDMLLHRYPEHPYASARYGTIVSRFRDSGALTELAYLVELTGMQYTKLAPWIWSPKVAKQFVQVLKKGEEISNEYSYTMYMMEMGLSRKSPYGIGANPDLHFWVHTVGCCHLKDRSKNAILVGNPEQGNILVMAKCLGYVTNKNASIQKTFGTSRTENVDQEEADLDVEDDIPKAMDPDTWLGHMQDRNGIIPPRLDNLMFTRWRRFGDARAKTIGKLLHDLGQEHVED